MDCPKKSFLFMILCMALLFNYNNGGIVDAATNIGLNYGLLGDNLPSPSEVINLYKSLSITNIRIFDTNTDVLNAFRGNRNIGVIVGVKNQDLAALAVSEDSVNTWFVTNIEPYLADVNITFITVGNEVIPGEIGSHVLPVMQSLTNVVKSRSLPILISTTVAMTNLGKSYPPSAGDFTPQAREQLIPVLKFLSQTYTPILVNIYPYFAYASDRINIRIDYATLNTEEVVVQDGPLSYSNMFDVIFDAFVWAMEKEGVKDLPMVVAETGWPSAGNGNLTTPEIAAIYNTNFVKHVDSGKGTPKRPKSGINGFLFATFNENQKPAGTEQNFGLYNPTDMKPIYKLF
ncbi:putative glucan endo-1,3-beta-glucosidase BG5 [Cardamine amara subsp. amara]|uniref:glucan endo-1,3-beta-D-glucosidase n=1 Tax=Cardamine amara subsp. amara TaxID=228776 RepID=A0ABD0Z307_CARAN